MLFKSLLHEEMIDICKIKAPPNIGTKNFVEALKKCHFYMDTILWNDTEL